MDKLLEKQIVVNDLLINYYFLPGSPKEVPLVFLHGWNSESRFWFKSISKLAGKQNIFFFDLPGFGKSQKPKKPFGLNDYTQILISAFKKIGIKKAILTGHSFGGAIALSMAVNNPNSIEKLILVASSGIRPQTIKKKTVRAIARLVHPLFVHKSMQGIRKNIYKKLKADDYLNTSGVMRKTYRRIINHDVTSVLKKIKHKTLIIWGERDEETPLEDAKVFKDNISDSEMVVLSAAGHFCFVDNPDKFISEVERFVKV
ncbi:alpha/beta fold hydrolase [Patescibacteria group bacterium]